MVWSSVGWYKGVAFTKSKVEFSPSSSTSSTSVTSSYFAVCAGTAIRLYAVSTGELVRTLEGHKGRVTGVVFALGIDNANKLLYSCSKDGSIKLWNIEENKIVAEYYVKSAVQGIQLNPLNPKVLYAQVKLETGQSRVISFTLETDSSSILFNEHVHSFCVSPTGEYVAAIRDTHLFVWNVRSQTLTEYTATYSLKTVCIHPNDDMVATGNTRGQIHFWYCLKSATHKRKGKCTTKEIHWHAHPVSTLAFTADSAHILSGGEEAVVVITHIETGKMAFMPRLGAAIKSISVSADSSLYGLILANNSILILNSVSRKVERKIQGLRPVTHPSLSVYPARNLLVSNSSDILQFYDPLHDRHQFELELSVYNKIRGPNKIPEPRVLHYCFSENGQCLATVEERLMEGIGREVVMKFWHAENNGFTLATRVDSPHLGTVDALAFHPTVNNVVSVSKTDKRFKIWAQVAVTETKAPVRSWMCKAIGTYRDLSPSMAAFSPDGSLMAVAFGKIITLWEASGTMLVAELSHSDEVTKFAFISHSPYLVSCTTDKLCVWNLLSCTIWWSYNTNAQYIATDPLSDRFLLIYNANGVSHLLLFEASIPTPCSHWRVKDPVACCVFLPKQSSSSSIVCLTETRRILMLEEYKLSEVAVSEVIAPQLYPESAGNVLEKLYGLESTKLNGDVMASSDNQEKSHVDVSSLFDAPSHVLPPLSALYKSFMELLIISDKHPGDVHTTEDSHDAGGVDQMDIESTPERKNTDEDTKHENNTFSLNFSQYEGMINFFKTQFNPQASELNGEINGSPAHKVKTPSKKRNKSSTIH